MVRKSKEPSGLRLTLEGTKLELRVRLDPLSTSRAGTSGLSFNNLCAEHKEPLKAPKTCLKCGPGVEMTEERTLKGYKVGDSFALLTHEQVANLKPKGDNSVQIVKLSEFPGAGWLAARVGAKAITPIGEDPSTLKRWAALRAILGPHRVGVAMVTNRGNFTWAVLELASSGAILATPIYLSEDLKPIPSVPVPALSEAELRAFEAKGAELVLAHPEFPEFVDPYRQAREEAVMAALRGDVPEPEPVSIAKAMEKEEDLVAAIL